MAAYFPLGSSRRFLIYLSYVGHEFRGVQKQPPVLSEGSLKVLNTVQGTLEDSLKFVFKPFHDVNVTTSSRTDAGVHCLRSAVHVDLNLSNRLTADSISIGLNKHFTSENIGMRILRTQSVPNWFSARHHAISRTYLYRFAIRKDSNECNEKFLNEIPFSEYGRALFLQNPGLDFEKMHKCASMLEGTKNFLCFMSKPLKKKPSLTTMRTIYSLKIKPGRPFMPDYDPHANLFDHWDIICHGRSFLYRQIRRIVGVLLAVGRGQIELDKVQQMLDNPVPESWDPRAVCVPPWGLYLLDVSYNPLHFHNFDEPEDKENQRTTLALTY